MSRCLYSLNIPLLRKPKPSGKTPDQCAHLLETTPLFANIHAESASAGQTSVPTDTYTDLHFVCFVEAPEAEFRDIAEGDISAPDPATVKKGTGMRLIELEGTRAGPIDRGECNDLLTVRKPISIDVTF